MRLDKYLCLLEVGTRSQVKNYIRQGLVTINGRPAQRPEQKIEEEHEIIAFRGKELHYKKYCYYMLNKPPGVVSATRDNTAGTVVELLGDDRREGIFPVGRLDKDTVGLLLLTNDGELAHRLLSPKHHVDKTYLVTVEHTLQTEDIRRLEEGVDIGEERPTMPAKAEISKDGQLLLTIREGKYHQVKRMLRAIDNEVITLKRISFGGITLDENLKPGQYRELTEQEVRILHGLERDT